MQRYSPAHSIPKSTTATTKKPNLSEFFTTATPKGKIRQRTQHLKISKKPFLSTKHANGCSKPDFLQRLQWLIETKNTSTQPQRKGDFDRACKRLMIGKPWDRDSLVFERERFWERALKGRVETHFRNIRRHQEV